MDTENIPNEGFQEIEFDKWLSNQLKESVVSPPKNFTNKVMATLQSNEIKPNNDPFLIIILSSLSIILAIIVCVIFIIPNDWFIKNGLSFISQWFNNIWLIVIYITLALIMGVGFMGLDQLFEKKIGRQRYAI